VRATEAPRSRHPLHLAERAWPESNCYVDLWIEVLHHLGADPHAMLPCAVASRYEGDQWTFSKPSASEIASLYGIRVDELTIWRPLRDHVTTQLEAGRIVLVEVDGFHLPDTEGVSYRLAHQKTTIGIRALDEPPGSMAYFHNAGHFTVVGDDLEGALGSTVTSAGQPPFAELVDLTGFRLDGPGVLRRRSLDLAVRRLAGAPRENPFDVWSRSTEVEIARLRNGGDDAFHAWAFATLRQAGSMAELLGAWCDWVSDDAALQDAGVALRSIAQTLKAQQFRLARVPRGGPAPDLAGALRRCAPSWDHASRAIERVARASAGAVEGETVLASSDAPIPLAERIGSAF
jgi:hypothetical protein